MKRDYELTLLARADVSDEDVKMALQAIKDVIMLNGGTIVYVEYWGMRQLEYKINKNDSATFYMIQFNSDSEINSNLEEKLRNSEIFIRYLLVVADSDSLGIKTPNCVSNSEHLEDGVVFDKRYYNIVNSVFNIKKYGEN